MIPKQAIADRNVKLVYATILLLGVAYGASLSVTPLELTALKFGKPQIGTIAIWFAGGIIAMSVPAGALVRRISARTTLVVCVLAYAIAVALFPLQRTYAGVAIVRAVDGACSVGVWVACETVLLARSDRSHKALVTSLYAMAIAVGYVVGSGLARALVTVTSYAGVFFVASGVAALGAVVGSRLDRSAHAAHVEAGAEASVSASALLWRIKTSCLATFSYGYFQAVRRPLLAALPRSSTRASSRSATRSIMTAFFAGGMLLFSPVAARLGDRHGHLRTMRALASVGVVMILGFVFLAVVRAHVRRDLRRGRHARVDLAGEPRAAGRRHRSARLQPRERALQRVLRRGHAARAAHLEPRSSTAKGGPAMLYHLAAMWTAFVVATIVFSADDPSRPRDAVTSLRARPR